MYSPSNTKQLGVGSEGWCQGAGKSEGQCQAGGKSEGRCQAGGKVSTPSWLGLSFSVAGRPSWVSERKTTQMVEEKPQPPGKDQAAVIRPESGADMRLSTV